jgi:hypothetical protein
MTARIRLDMKHTLVATGHAQLDSYTLSRIKYKNNFSRFTVAGNLPPAKKLQFYC